ncbi:response regulator [Jiulongibacter sediminis]|jgi:CheY-like chemotaxis protein|uniref:response regulator n=1 Tax=Jiulongibacter sediminis TaxID=1605367 RepID=UPI0026EDD5A6|nr:response regulator [Jiulongibacter sediminis]
MYTKKIFLVDDDPFWVAVLKQILAEIGYTNVLTFEGGEDCLANLCLNPEVIFLDKEMQDMDGLDVLDKIKESNPAIEVVFCTSLEDLSVAIKALRSGSNDFLLKTNVNKKEVSELLEKIHLTC